MVSLSMELFIMYVSFYLSVIYFLMKRERDRDTERQREGGRKSGREREKDFFKQLTRDCGGW